MLSKDMLLEDVEEKYILMLKEVNIPDFTKCIAQFSGLNIDKVNEQVIKSYLLTWAKNKYRFYKMFGNKLKKDNLIEYKDENIDVLSSLREMERDFPSFAMWLEGFRYVSANKLREVDISYITKETIERIFPDFRIDGSSMTHFFKSYLKAPDELVTRIGKIWEHETIAGNYTISIDPVDMMLASENPYDWQSCYRLEVFDGGSHADGCLAAILDDSSLITYVWNREGKYSLYNRYNFKNIRYYRMRQWISISPKQTAIHFNDIYPGKSYSEEFQKMLRTIVEALVDDQGVWKRNQGSVTNCVRVNPYGYGEFSRSRIFKIEDKEDEYWEVYNEDIFCPCGCGDILPGSDANEDWAYDNDCDMWEYNGDGFIAENFYVGEPEGQYCDYIDDYCEDSSDCENCYYWRKEHPICELDGDTCEVAKDGGMDYDQFNPADSDIVYCGRNCEGCPRRNKEYHKEK